MEFKIRRGPSTVLFENYEKKIPNPKLVIEDGCWYLSTDTAELLLGVKDANGQLSLKPINESYFSSISHEGSSKSAIKAEINVDGELVIYYSDNSSENLGKVIGKDGKDGLTTTIKVGDEVFTHESGTISLPEFATVDYVDDIFNNLVFPDVDLTDYVKKEELPDFSGFITEIPKEYITESELTAKGYLTEHQDLSEYAKNKDIENLKKTIISQKYEVLPIEGMIVNYGDNEVRLNTQRVIPTHQSVGETGNPNMFYATFRAYAPSDATGVIESDGANTDAEPTVLSVDSLGRKYATIWTAIAQYNGTKWTKWGDSSTINKYLGFYYTFKWFKDDILIGIDKVRVILTNDECHSDLVPDVVARRIDDELASYSEVVDKKIAEAQLNGDVNLDNYATKEDIKDFILEDNVDDKVEEILTKVILHGGNAVETIE